MVTLPADTLVAPCATLFFIALSLSLVLTSASLMEHVWSELMAIRMYPDLAMMLATFRMTHSSSPLCLHSTAHTPSLSESCTTIIGRLPGSPRSFVNMESNDIPT